jgi:FKBP-type peptidyl-prolyl cis-trans isomerase FkpA
MRNIFSGICIVLLLATSVSAANVPDSEQYKTLYSIGLIVSRSLTVFNLAPEELEIVKKGLTDSVEGKKLEVDLKNYNEKVQEFARSRRKAQAEKLAASNRAFLDNASKETGAVKTNSGLVYLSVKEGTGTPPMSSDTVKVNYRGTLPDGTEFDSSYKRGKPLEFRLDGVIKCWTEGLQKMKPGGKARLVCPSEIAYGDTGAGDLILPGATLVFEVELLEVKQQGAVSKPATPPSPEKSAPGAGK